VQYPQCAYDATCKCANAEAETPTASINYPEVPKLPDIEQVIPLDTPTSPAMLYTVVAFNLAKSASYFANYCNGLWRIPACRHLIYTDPMACGTPYAAQRPRMRKAATTGHGTPWYRGSASEGHRPYPYGAFLLKDDKPSVLRPRFTHVVGQFTCA
jgi:hypothetical protein